MGTELQLYSKNERLQLWAEWVRKCRESGKTVADLCAVFRSSLPFPAISSP